MLSKYNNNKPTWAGNNRSQALPSKIRCAIGREWKEPHHFSNNQLKVWHSTKRSPNDGVTGENIGLICREHSGAPALEMKCNGPCGQRKHRDKFSRSQRQNKLRWCQGCIRWQAQQDYDSIPVAAPNEVNDAADEREGFASVEEGIGFLADEDHAQGPLGQSGSLPDIASDDDIGTDNDDEGGPQSVRIGDRRSDDDDNDGDNNSDDEFIAVSNLAPVASISQPMCTMSISNDQSRKSLPGGSSSQMPQASLQPSLKTSFMSGSSNAMSSIPALVSRTTAASQPTSNNTRDSLQSQSTQASTSAWVAPHLLARENIVTLRERNLTERHIPGNTNSFPSSSTANTPTPSHFRAGPSRNTAATTHPQPTVNSRASNGSGSIVSTGGQSHVSGYQTGSPSNQSGQRVPIASMQSVASSDSRAGIQTMATNLRDHSGSGSPLRGARNQGFNAFDPQGNAHRRVVRRASTEPSTAASQSTHIVADRSKPARGNFARPDRRRIFNTVSSTNARTGQDHVDVVDSGSDDDM